MSPDPRIPRLFVESPLSFDEHAMSAFGSHPSRSAARAAARSLALALVTGCGESPVDPSEPPTISIGLTPSSAFAAQATSVTVTGSATVGGSFSGDVAFTVSGLPAGAAPTVGSITPPGPGDATFSAPIQVDVAASVPPGTYSGVVTASGSGVTAEATYSLTVLEEGRSLITLSASPSVSVDQGEAVIVTFGLVNDAPPALGDPKLTVEDLPSGVAVNVTTGALYITADAGAPTGTTTVTMRATLPGVPDATVTFDLTVTAPSASLDLVVDHSMCPLDEQPVWLAVQDGAGTGAWTRVTGAGAVYDISVTETTFGLATVFDAPSQTDVAVIYYGVAQIEDDTIYGCGSPTGKMVTGTAAGVVGFSSLALGGASTALFVDGPFGLTAVPEGARDLVGFSLNASGGPDRMLITRDLDIPTNGSLGTVDFASGFTPATATITVDGLSGGEDGFVGMEYATAYPGPMCALSPLHSDVLQASGPVTFLARSAPAVVQTSDELHVATVTAALGDGIKRVKEAFAVLGDRTVAMPPDLPTPSLTDVTAGGYFRLRAEYTLPAEYDAVTAFGYAHDSHGVGILATGDAMSSEISLEMPDFSGVAGWDDDWTVAAGSTGVEYTVTATGLTSRTALCADGGRQVQAILTDTYN